MPHVWVVQRLQGNGRVWRKRSVRTDTSIRSSPTMTTLRRLMALAVAGLVGLSMMGAAATMAAKTPNYIDLKKVPKPKITGAEIIGGLEEFVDKFPLRQNALPNNEAAAQFLADEAKKYG